MAARFVASHSSLYPNGLRFTVRPLGEVVTRDVKPALLALGAAVGFVIREGSLLTGLGATLGLAGAIAVTRALRALLYGVTPLDGLTIVSVVAVVAVVALVAVGWPAWRAARADPTTARRAEEDDHQATK